MPFPLPCTTTVRPDTGALRGATGRYEKRFSDLRGLFLDEAALEATLQRSGDAIAYSVEDYKPSANAGDLIFGVSTLQPGRIGDEFLMTRGHIHAQSDRPEIYYCQAGHGVMLMELQDGTIEAAEMRPQSLVYVAPHWIHRSVNVGAEPLVTVFCYPADAGQDYDIIARAGGMRMLIVADAGGWAQRPNPRYRPRARAA
jgi:glucose-6-phosphate isomerase